MPLTKQHLLEVKAAMQGKLALLSGGTSAEREISRISGDAIAEALSNTGIEFIRVDTAAKNWINKLHGCSHAFIALHGGDGEDGTVQAVLKTLGLSFTGSGVLASALAMDKLRTKQLWQGVGIPSPVFQKLTASSDWAAVMADMPEMMVKPSTEGSSIGMRRVSSASGLKAAWQEASHYDSDVLAEQFITGPEYTVAVLDGQSLPAIRLEAKNDFYDFDAKYKSDDTLYHCPCGLDSDAEAELKTLSLAAYESLGCEGWGRVDVMRDERSGKFYVLEVNTVPGMTDHSLVPMAAKAAGYSFENLVMIILGVSLGLSFSLEVGA